MPRTPGLATLPRPLGRAPGRNVVPLILVGILGLLAAGAAILAGVFQSPATTDLVVHNAAGETAGASTVRGTYTATTLAGDTLHFVYQSPDRVTTYFSGPSGQLNHRPQSATGPTAVRVLLPVTQLQQLDGFTASGSSYVITKPFKDLVARSLRHQVRGTFRATVTVATGYVVRLQEDLAGVETRGGHAQQIASHADYRLSQVDGWSAT